MGTVAMVIESVSRESGDYSRMIIAAGATVLSMAGIGVGTEVVANNLQNKEKH